MGIELYPHNQKAYESALSTIARTGEAAVVHPTGTGKSFIGFKFAETFPNARVCWLSPSEYIVKTQLENLKAAGQFLDNVIFITYAKLTLLRGSEIQALAPDYIILDEFHRCGALEWGGGVRRLFKFFPNAKILGLSATNIRYLDNRRDMAEELFNGNIASEITLGEAIARGILPAPVYVISIYSYKKDLEKYGRRTEQIQNAAAKNAAREQLAKLKRALENAGGLGDVFKKYMTKGKYIVFCSGKERMAKLISRVPEHFSGVDSNPKVYAVYADAAGAEKIFQEFKADKSDRLRLLFCINMLNEGVHFEDISGVILFRPTASPIVYKQQIGRALSAGKRDARPIIFDAVNNFENLRCVGAIQEEIDNFARRAEKTGGDPLDFQFEVIDETRDCGKIFAALQSAFSAGWDLNYESAKKYFEANGNLNVPINYIDSRNFALGQWIQTQRRVRAGRVLGILSEERAEKLGAIGMIWEKVNERRWEECFERAEKYFNERGHLDVCANYADESGFRLGAWISSLRRKRSLLELSAERIGRLNSIGMIWDKQNLQWERNYQKAAEYFAGHGNLEIPRRNGDPGRLKIAAWLDVQRQTRRGETKNAPLSEAQIKRLDAIGMNWGGKFLSQWEKIYRAAREYYAANGHLNVPAGYKTPDGILLGKWIYRQRNSAKLTGGQKALLDEIGMDWRSYVERARAER